MTINSYNPFRMWTVYILAILFVILGVYVALNTGNLPSFLAVEENGGGHLTFLGIIVLVLAFPVAFFGLTLEGSIPSLFYYLLIIISEFVYGFLLGWGIHSLSRKIRNMINKNRSGDL